MGDPAAEYCIEIAEPFGGGLTICVLADEPVEPDERPEIKNTIADNL